MRGAIDYLIMLMAQMSVDYRRLLLQGTRNHALYLAQHHRKPKGDVEAHEGMSVPQRYFYGFYSDDL
jgi:hypothetical protein